MLNLKHTMPIISISFLILFCPGLNAQENIISNKDAILAAMYKDPFTAFKYASDNLKRNRDIVLSATEISAHALKYADQKFRKNKGFILDAIKLNAFALRYADDNLKDDKEVVLAALNSGYGNLLKYASKRLQADKEVVYAAVNNGGSIAFQYAGENLKRDKGFILKITKKDFHSSIFEYIDGDLKKDRNFVLRAVKANGLVLGEVDKVFRKDQEIVQSAINENPNAKAFIKNQNSLKNTSLDNSNQKKSLDKLYQKAKQTQQKADWENVIIYCMEHNTDKYLEEAKDTYWNLITGNGKDTETITVLKYMGIKSKDDLPPSIWKHEQETRKIKTMNKKNGAS